MLHVNLGRHAQGCVGVCSKRAFQEKLSKLINYSRLLLLLIILVSTSTAYADLVATVPGDFSVGSTGAATYTIPITIAPGSGGVQPNVFLQYNSQGGPGLLGIGWSLGGLSTISRCPAVQVRDGKKDGIDFDASDRFCLDGQPLIAIYASGAPIEHQNIDSYYGQSGTEYRTEIDSYSKIISHGSTGNGPSYFTVKAKSGEITEYGNTSDSLFNPPNADGTPQSHALAWQANKISDRLGNYLTVTYNENAGAHYPLKIEYTGNTNAGIAPYNSIEFEYEGNPQAGTSYIGGKKLAVSQRMHKILTKSEGQILREYNLSYMAPASSYQKSILTSVTECAGGECAPATTFEYPTNNFGAYDTRSGVATYIPGDHPSAQLEIARTKYGDFNGDGNVDIYYVTGNGSTQQDFIYQGDPDGILYTLNQIYSGFVTTSFSTPVTTTLSGAHNDIDRIKFADFNGDGYTDVYYMNGSGSTEADTVYLNNRDASISNLTFTTQQTGITTYVRSYAESAYGASYDIARLNFGDFNGDGRTDIYYVNGSGNAQSDQVFLSNGDGTFANAVAGPSTYIGSTLDQGFVDLARFRFADLNSDGLTDLYHIQGFGSAAVDNVYLAKGDGTFHPAIAGISSYVSGTNDGAKMDMSRLQFGDFNGDGIPDAYYVNGWGTSAADSIYMGRGDGTYSTSPWPGPATYVSNNIASANLDISRVNLGDFNGDGLADVYRIEGSNTFTLDKVWLGNPHGWVGLQGGAYNGPSTYVGASNTAAETDLARFSFQDFDSDGITDVHYMKGFGAPGSSDIHVSNAEHNYITKITNGFGSEIDVEYSNTALNIGYGDLKGYSRDFSLVPAAGEVFYVGPMQIVTETRIDNGINGQNVLTYIYNDAKLSLTGRGFLSFASRTVIDSSNKLHVTTHYRQDFPYIGLVSKTETTLENPLGPLNDRILLSEQTSTYLAKGNLITGPAFPYEYSGSNENYEVQGGGSSIVTTTGNFSLYDDYGNPTTVVNTTNDSSGNYFTYTFNSYEAANTADWILGRLSSSEVYNYSSIAGYSPHRHAEFTYDSNGLLKTEVIEPGTNFELTTLYGYDAFGNETGTGVYGYQLPARMDSITTYDPKGRYPITLTNALSQSESREYNDPHGLVTKITGPNGLSTNFSYDLLGRKILEFRGDGTSTNTTYALCGICPDHTISTAKYKITTISSGIPTKIEYYDISNRVIISEYENFTAKPNRTFIEYDSDGRVDRQSMSFIAYSNNSTPIYWTDYNYDNRGRIIEENSSATGLTTISYNGLITSVTNSLNQTTEEYVNSKGQTIWAKDADNNITSFEYDSFGNLIKSIDPQGNEVINTFDLNGRKISMTDPDMGIWNYIYDVQGQLVSQTDAKNQTVTMTYDNLGRMTSRTEAEGTTSWTYDTGYKAIGKLSSESAPGGFSRSYTFDIFGRPSSTTTVIGGTSYTVSNTYDGFSRLDKTIYPNNFQIKNVYNQAGHLFQVHEAGNPSNIYWNKISVDAHENTQQYINGNNSNVYKFHENSTGRLILAATMASGVLEQYLRYSYNDIGNLIERKDHAQGGLAETFNYDNLNRLTQSSITGIGVKTFDYDSIGNITNKSDVGSYTYGQNNAGPHAVTQTVGVLNNSYTYDANGNQITGDGRAITWSSYNKPTQINKGVFTSSLKYGPNRVRYEQTQAGSTGTSTTTYIGSLYEKVEKAGLTTHKNYIFADGQAVAIYESRSNSTSDEFYLSRDHIGSVDTITNATGAVVEKLSFDSFGKRRQVNWQDAIGIIASIITRGFTGHEMLDGVGLIHMNGRVYDASLGRFASADPHIQAPNNAQSYNRYSYVLNNPLSYTDPSGFFFKSLFRGIKKFFKGIGRAIQKIASNEILGPLVAVAAAFFTAGATLYALGASSWATASLTIKVVAGAAGGFAGGFIGSGGDVKAGLIGAVTGAALVGVSHAFQGVNTSFGSAGHAGQTLAHGAVGGGSAELSGGKFGRGFASAAFTTAFSPGIESINSATGRVVASAVVGGTASSISGGKFANGAKTFAFLRLSGEFANYAKVRTDRLKKLAEAAGGRKATYDERGVMETDGGRDVDYKTYNPEERGNILTRAGMSQEGAAHSYDNIKVVKHFVVDVSKIHDYFNSWNYSPTTGFYLSRGVVFDSVFQVYSFAGMPVAALATVAGYAGNVPMNQQIVYHNLYRNIK